MILYVDEMLRVTKERRLAGRQFQMIGAAVRNPRVPNDKLHHVTDNRLVEAGRKHLHAMCWWNRLARYGGLPVIRAFQVSVAILNLMRASIGSQ